MEAGGTVNLRELMMGVATRVRYVHRWSSFHVLHRESVAEHSFFTSFYCLLLGRWLQMQGHAVNMGLLLGRSLMHDLDEAFSGDFIRSFKHATPELARVLHRAASVFHRKLCCQLTDHEVLRDSLHEYWSAAKYDDLEGRVLRFADYLSVLSYALMERRAGNTMMTQKETDLMEYGQTFMLPEFDFLTPYPAQAIALMEELL